MDINDTVVKSRDGITGWGETEDEELSSSLKKSIKTTSPLSRQNSAKEGADNHTFPSRTCSKGSTSRGHESTAVKRSPTAKSKVDTKPAENRPQSRTEPGSQGQLHVEKAAEQSKPVATENQSRPVESTATPHVQSSDEVQTAGPGSADDSLDIPGPDVLHIPDDDREAERSQTGDEEVGVRVDLSALHSSLNTSSESLEVSVVDVQDGEDGQEQIAENTLRDDTYLTLPASCAETLNALRKIRPNPKVSEDKLGPPVVKALYVSRPETPETVGTMGGRISRPATPETTGIGGRHAIAGIRPSSSQHPQRAKSSDASLGSSGLRKSFSHQCSGRDKGGCFTKVYVNSPSVPGRGRVRPSTSMSLSTERSEELRHLARLDSEESSSRSSVFQRPASVSGAYRRLPSAQQRSLRSSLNVSHMSSSDSIYESLYGQTERQTERVEIPLRSQTPEAIPRRMVRTPQMATRGMPSRHNVRTAPSPQNPMPRIALQIHSEIARRVRSGRRTAPQSSIFQPMILHRPGTAASHLRYSPRQGMPPSSSSAAIRRSHAHGSSRTEEEDTLLDVQEYLSEETPFSPVDQIEDGDSETHLELDLSSWMSRPDSEVSSPLVRSPLPGKMSPFSQRPILDSTTSSTTTSDAALGVVQDDDAMGHIDMHTLENVLINTDYGRTRTFACNMAKRRTETVKLLRHMKG